MKIFLLSEETTLLRAAVIEGEKVKDFFVEKKTSPSLVGNIYKGKVKDVLPGMDAAFVDIGWERTAYLYISEVIPPAVDVEQPEWEEGKNKLSIEKLLHKGEEVLVQVVRDPIGSKGPRLTSFITIPGRYLVLMPFSSYVGVSRRIAEAEERRRLRKIAMKIKPKEMGLIVRTMAQGKNLSHLSQDLKYLLQIWKKAQYQAERSSPPSLIYEEVELGMKLLRDFYESDSDCIITDSPSAFKRLKRFASQILPRERVNIQLHRGGEGVFEAYHLEEELEKVLQPVVRLKSGGYITIYETEALVSIDVNTGRFTGEESLEDTAFRINLEASEEIARQIRLRNLGGIIVVDFIDMRVPAHRKKLERHFLEKLKEDKARIQISRITQFGLIQMTRERTGPSLSHLLCDPCPYCGGSGMVKSLLTVENEVIRKAKKVLKDKRIRSLKLVLAPELYRRFTHNEGWKKFPWTLRRKIVLEERENLKGNEYIFCLPTGKEIKV